MSIVVVGIIRTLIALFPNAMALLLVVRRLGFSSVFPISLLVPSSERIVQPSSETPTKTPRARDQDRISAFMTTFVSAEGVRPTGPASAPNLTLLGNLKKARVATERSEFSLLAVFIASGQELPDILAFASRI